MGPQQAAKCCNHMLLVPLLACGGTHANLDEGMVSGQMYSKHVHVCVSCFQRRPSSSHRIAEVA